MSVSTSNELGGLAGVAGGFAPLDSGILVPRSYLPQIAGLLHNMGASADPTVTDDSGDGYGVGSRWLNTTLDNEFICLDASVGAAIWANTTIHGAWIAYTPTLTAVTTNPAVVNGSLVGRYKMIGSKTCMVRVYYGRGTSDTAGSGAWRVALPFAAHGTGKSLLNLSAIDAGTTYYIGQAQLVPGTAVTGDLTLAQAPSTASTAGVIAITHNAPFTWATSDELMLSGIYEIS